MNKININQSLLLTLIFGPFGLLYSTKRGALIMIALSIFYGISIYEEIGLLNLKWYSLILVISLLWGYIATKHHGKEESGISKGYILQPFILYDKTQNGRQLLIDIALIAIQVVVFLVIVVGHYNYVTKGFWFY